MKQLRTLAISIAALFALTASAWSVDHKLAIHVDENDPQVMNMALNNAENVKAYYAGKGETVAIEIVAYGPGLKMYTEDSPVRNRISTMSLESEHMAFSACGNTLKAMEKKSGKKVNLITEAKVVPSGVVRLMELQGEGYAYVRP